MKINSCEVTHLYRMWERFEVYKLVRNNKCYSRLTNRRSMTNETARILQAQAAWAVARIIHDTLFRITLIFKCRLYSLMKKEWFKNVFTAGTAEFDSKFPLFLLTYQFEKGCFLNGNVDFLIEMRGFGRFFRCFNCVNDSNRGREN